MREDYLLRNLYQEGSSLGVYLTGKQFMLIEKKNKLRKTEVSDLMNSHLTD